MSELDKPILLLMMDTIEKIEEFSKPFHSVDEFENDVKAFDACLMNFIVIGELVLKLSDDFIENNDDIEWYKIRAFRNFAAHDYFGIDVEKVWEIIQTKLPELKIKVKQIINK